MDPRLDILKRIPKKDEEKVIVHRCCLSCSLVGNCPKGIDFMTVSRGLPCKEGDKDSYKARK